MYYLIGSIENNQKWQNKAPLQLRSKNNALPKNLLPKN
jgi:hypothetical protein